MERQHIVDVVCVKVVFMVQEQLEGDFVSFACFFKKRCGHSSAFSDCREGYKEGMNHAEG